MAVARQHVVTDAGDMPSVSFVLEDPWSRLDRHVIKLVYAVADGSLAVLKTLKKTGELEETIRLDLVQDITAIRVHSWATTTMAGAETRKVFHTRALFDLSNSGVASLGISGDAVLRTPDSHDRVDEWHRKAWVLRLARHMAMPEEQRVRGSAFLEGFGVHQGAPLGRQSSQDDVAGGDDADQEEREAAARLVAGERAAPSQEMLIGVIPIPGFTMSPYSWNSATFLGIEPWQEVGMEAWPDHDLLMLRPRNNGGVYEPEKEEWIALARTFQTTSSRAVTATFVADHRAGLRRVVRRASSAKLGSRLAAWACAVILAALAALLFISSDDQFGESVAVVLVIAAMVTVWLGPRTIRECTARRATRGLGADEYYAKLVLAFEAYLSNEFVPNVLQRVETVDAVVLPTWSLRQRCVFLFKRQ